MNKFATAYRPWLGILVLAMSGATAGTPASKENTAGTAGDFNGPFVCSMVAGLLITQEWYTAGFETDGIDDTKWQGMFMHYGYVDIWAQDPPGGYTWNAPIHSGCTKNSTMPDRVIFTAWSWELAYTEAKFATATAEAVRKFKKNFPSMKRLELVTLARCPKDPANPAVDVSGKHCNPNAAIPPTSGVTNKNAGQQDCYVPPEVDSALEKVAAMPEFAGLVYVGPKFYSRECRVPVDGGHLGSNNNQVAKDVANYYMARP